MTHRRSHPADHVHFAPGLAGTLGWMSYWATSRSENTKRLLYRHWQSRLRPALTEQTATFKGRVTTALHRPDGADSPRPYESLADAVRQRGLMDVHG